MCWNTLGPFIMGCAGSWDKSMMSRTFQLSRGLCPSCTTSFEAAVFLVLHAGKGRERTISFNRPFTPVNVTLRCFFIRTLAGLQEGHCPLFFQNPFSVFWSISCPSLTVSGCTYTKAFWVSTFQSEQPQSARHFSSSFCSPVVDSVCEHGGQVFLQV